MLEVCKIMIFKYVSSAYFYLEMSLKIMIVTKSVFCT